jgi:DNA-directed RNA polymerase specialized sigma24 family protein
MSEKSTDQLLLFSEFIDFYYPSIYSAITKLTGISDAKELENITMDIFDELWKTRDQVLTELRPPAFIYKILIRHVFAYLRKQGAEDRISALQGILYSIPEEDQRSKDTNR